MLYVKECWLAVLQHLMAHFQRYGCNLWANRCGSCHHVPLVTWGYFVVVVPSTMEPAHCVSWLMSDAVTEVKRSCPAASHKPTRPFEVLYCGRCAPFGRAEQFVRRDGHWS